MRGAIGQVSSCILKQTLKQTGSTRYCVTALIFFCLLQRQKLPTQMLFDKLPSMTTFMIFVSDDGISHMALLWWKALCIFCSHLFIRAVIDALQSCHLVSHRRRHCRIGAQCIIENEKCQMPQILSFWKLCLIDFFFACVQLLDSNYLGRTLLRKFTLSDQGRCHVTNEEKRKEHVVHTLRADSAELHLRSTPVIGSYKVSAIFFFPGREIYHVQTVILIGSA